MQIGVPEFDHHAHRATAQGSHVLSALPRHRALQFVAVLEVAGAEGEARYMRAVRLLQTDAQVAAAEGGEVDREPVALEVNGRVTALPPVSGAFSEPKPSMRRVCRLRRPECGKGGSPSTRSQRPSSTIKSAERKDRP